MTGEQRTAREARLKREALVILKRYEEEARLPAAQTSWAPELLALAVPALWRRAPSRDRASQEPAAEVT